MKAFLLACLAIAVIAGGAWYGLREIAPYSSAQQQTSQNVRLGDEGPIEE